MRTKARPGRSVWMTPSDSVSMFTLDRSEIHLWSIPSLEQEPDWELARALLSTNELDALRSAPTPARSRWALRRAALRAVLGRYVRLSPSNLAFRYGAFGKPRLADPCGVYFSTATSQGAVLIAVGAHPLLGVDLETMHPVANVCALARPYFADEELARLQEAPASARTRLFYRYWTCKEAYVKALGGGFTVPGRSFAVATNDRGEAVLARTLHDQPVAWTMVAWETKTMAAASVVVRDRRPLIVARTWDPLATGSQTAKTSGIEDI